MWFVGVCVYVCKSIMVYMLHIFKYILYKTNCKIVNKNLFGKFILIFPLYFLDLCMMYMYVNVCICMYICV